MAPKQDIHHVSCHFGKSKVLFSLPGSTTLASLKLTLLSALPHLYPSNNPSSLPGLDADDMASMDLPCSPSQNPDLPKRVRYTREFCLWKARLGEDGELISYVSLEGDVDDFDPLENMPGPSGASGSGGKGKGKANGHSITNGTASDADEYTIDVDGDDAEDENEGGGGGETGERAVELKNSISRLTNPVWERWVNVYVSFVEPDGTFNPPNVIKPALFDDEQDDGEVAPVENGTERDIAAK